ncbi:alpha/beta hydrolase [Mycolicibacterium mengxianglii]|uniref:alpha/beta hydrolase n=1 Tax=Mycolicibacterium mengxianglii TaxID=2736649 RepID=UPI0018D162B6|nr:alpha/beta hydrolase [Mycolicibacterium mengxianglii]
MKFVKRFVALLLSLFVAVVTANGYRPLTKRGYPSLYAFGFGVFTSELPLQLLAGHAAAFLPMSRGLGKRSGVIAWVLSATSWLALVGLYRAGRDADKPLTAALDDGLGADRRRDSHGLWEEPVPGGATAKKPGVVRMLRIYRDYAHDSDIQYGEFGRRNSLDIWRRPDLPRHGRAPVLLQVHGGAWMLGSKRGQAHPLLSHLTELGWVCVSINYRLSPRSTWPDHLVDVKRAIAWTRDHIFEYGGDPDWMAITGGSAGGHLSSLAALTANDPRFQPGFEDADTSIQAAVPFYGVYDLTRSDAALHPLMIPMLERRVFKRRRKEAPDAFDLSSPIHHVSPQAPPFFVLHGTNDSLIPVEQARTFTAKLRDVSTAPVVYAEMPLAQHAFDIFGSPRAAHAAVAVEQFLAEIYTRSAVNTAD